MNEAAFSPNALQRSIPFKLRGFEGHVQVRCEANADPEGWGFGLLNLPFDLEQAKGFPVCEARIAYGGPGYYGTMGWIQLVTVEELSGERWTEVDQTPNQRGLELPFTVFGEKPTMFDAPGPNPPRSDETWLAETFLVFCPDVGRTRTVQALTGFRWGYRLEARRPTLLPLEVCSLERWNAHLPYLDDMFPSWTLLENADLGVS